MIEDVAGLPQDEYSVKIVGVKKHFLMNLDNRSKEERLGYQSLAL